MRVPPPKEATKPVEHRRPSDEATVSAPRRSTTLTNRSSLNGSLTRKSVSTNVTKVEAKPSNAPRSDETEGMRTKVAHLEEEIRRLKRRIEELEKEITDLHKLTRTKDKRIAELTKENEDLKKQVRLSLLVGRL